MMQRIGGTVDAGALAIPEREYALHGALRIAFNLLAAEHGGSAGLFVDRRQEADVCSIQLCTGTPQCHVVRAERRTAVAADEACGIQPGVDIKLALHQGQAHQRLRAGQEHLT